MKRKGTLRIRTPEQLRVLGAPATLEVFESLQSSGPGTMAQVGERLGRKANTLHYHVRKLVRLGLVRAVDTRRSGARTETVYDVVADHFEGPTAPRDPALRKASTDVVASLLRLATRDYMRAAEDPGHLTRNGRHRNILVERHKAWLTPQALADVNRHLRAIQEIAHRHREPGRGQLCAMTVVMTPLGQDNEHAD